MNNIKIKSTVYPEKLSQEEWMNKFEVGSVYLLAKIQMYSTVLGF